jgi:ribose transport system substrate-binding protein
MRSRTTAVFAATAALALVAGCSATGEGGGSNAGDIEIGSSLSCDASPTQEELLAYVVPKADKPYNITMMQVSLAGYYYQAIDNGADVAAAAAGVTLQKFAAEGYASPDTQLKQIEDALLRGTDALVMAPSDIQGSIPVVEAAREAGIPVVNISSEVASEDVLMVMQDDYAFGQMAADRIASILGPDGGTGILIAGPANATWSQRRAEGFQDRVRDQYPNIKIAAAPTQNVDPAEGLRSFEDAVQATPEIDWIFAVHYYILQPAAISEEYRESVAYVSAGYEPDSIVGLEDGSIDSLFGLAPRWMGILGVGYAVSALNGDEIPRVTCIPIPLLTAEDIGSPFAVQELIP